MPISCSTVHGMKGILNRVVMRQQHHFARDNNLVTDFNTI